VGAEDPLSQHARLAELGRMTAVLNHELRQPLFAAKSIAQLLQTLPLDQDGHELVASLAEQLTYMEQLIAGVGVYSGQARDCGDPTDAVGTVRAVSAWMGHRAKNQGVQLQVTGAAGCAVAFDGVALTQIVVNLVSNAIDVSERNSVVVVSIHVDQVAEIRVQDQGPGVPAELAEQIFEPFFTTKPVGQGTGLGLALSRRLAVERAARLTLEPSASGACFLLELPLWRPVGS
jgi:signal transduction histidine kinase